MDPVFTIQQIDKATIVRIDLLAAHGAKADIQTLSDAMNELIDKKNQRKIIINFEKVELTSLHPSYKYSIISKEKTILIYLIAI